MRGDPHGVRPRMLLRGRLTIAVGVLLLLVVGHALLASRKTEAATDALSPVGAFPQATGSASGDTADEADPVEPTLPPSSPPSSAPAPAQAAAPSAGANARAVPDAILRRIPIPPPGGSRGMPRLVASGASAQVTRGRRITELVPIAPDGSGIVGPLRVEYTLDAGLTDAIYDIFARGRVQLGLAVVLDPASGEVLAYAGTDARRLPPNDLYPAASLVKVVTAAAALQSVPGVASRTCHFVGSPYRLTPSRLVPPRRGTEITLERALATSNNQCFAQLAVNDLGQTRLLETFRRFGLLQSPGPGHSPGEADTPDDGDRFALGKLGCGLAGLRITGLHAAELAATLADGKRVAPRWIARVSDAAGHELALPPRAGPEVVLPANTAAQLREMMVETTLSGTARRAFHGSFGRPLLREMTVAAKTGSLSGKAPPGRYEWFIALAPANRPKIAIAVLVVQQRRWHMTGSQVGAQVLNAIFCSGSVCDVDRANQWLAARSSASRRSFD